MIAANVTAERAGRENGAVRPIVTGRGRGACPAGRYAAYPWPAAGACAAVTT